MKTTFKDLVNEIKIIEEMIVALETRKTATVAIAAMTKNKTDKEMQEYIEDTRTISRKLEIYYNTLIELDKCKNNILNHIESMDGLEKKILYLKDVEGFTLLEISKHLNYSYQHIRRLHAEIKRR